MIAIHQIDLHTFLGRLDPDSVVVDLGMSDGGFAQEVVSRFGCHVFGLEPEPSLFAALPRLDQVTIEHAAASATNGVVTLYLNRSQCASTEFAAAESCVTVPSTTLTAFLDRHRLPTVDLVKMDIEGAEFDVLSSMSDRDLLRIRQLSIEFHDFLDSSQRPRVVAADRRLRELGFRRFKWSAFTYGDVLYVHPAVRLSALDRASILLRGKWLPGLRRRWVRSVSWFSARAKSVTAARDA